ncbi:hypothetical protein [Micromonospora zhanjiangensis]|uniref:Uncharacterized protein n=1 Tax=Micromonospora zhanjiangensis TaxID=1522057 RepID=A0ABV8KQS3_9ACTN
MAAKRTSRNGTRRTGGRPAVTVDRQDLDSIELAAPVDVPVPGAATADAGSPDGRKPAAGKGPRTGRGGLPGVGRTQAATQTRRYAFRRS